MRNAERSYLFYSSELSSFLEAQMQSAKTLVERIPREQFLSTAVDTLVENIEQQLLIDPLVLHEDKMQMEHNETKINVSDRIEYGGFDGRTVMTDGHQLNFYIPFSGEDRLWKMKPNVWSSVIPQGEIDNRKQLLTLSFSNTSNTEQTWYQRELQSTLQLIRQSISAQFSMLAQYHDSLSRTVRDIVVHRQQQIRKLQGLASAFNIPMVKKPGMPEYRTMDVQKKAIRVLPSIPSAGYKPEPAISEELYEEILSNIRHMGATFEGTPQTYKSLGEEGLRDILLASLNGVYKGSATGEAFRKYGKTDLRIEEESRAAFVGECKLWGGEQVLLGALEQLLDYLTWRDGKAAVIMFNKTVAGFTGLQETIGRALPGHEFFMRSRDIKQAGEWRFVFRSKEDEGREVTVHVFCFNLYVAPERISKKR